LREYEYLGILLLAQDNNFYQLFSKATTNSNKKTLNNIQGFFIIRLHNLSN